jgi:S-DNA-T family DNA segregation ATPase FtsK/SpoIIIE
VASVLFRLLGRGVVMGFRHPVVVAVLLALLLVWRRLGGLGLVAVVGGLVLVAVTWRLAHRRSFAPVSRWLLGRLRLSLVYRRRWRNTVTHTDLAIRIPMSNGDRVAFDDYFPRIRRFRTTGVVDSLRVELLPGQTPEQWAEQTEALRHAFRARAVRVRSDKRPGFVWLDVSQATRLPRSG